MDGSILSHTRQVAAGLAREFHGRPEQELEVWATTAQRREAMVVMLYDSRAIARRLPRRAGEPEILSVVRKAIGGIWAQERAHTTLVEALRVLDDARLSAMSSMIGAIEGRVTHCATANGWTAPIATFLVGLSRAADRVPEFTKAFRALTPRQFFRFSHELETTAKEGYERIIALLEQVDATSTARSDSIDGLLKLGITARYEFAKTLAEECFHAAVFEQLDAWLAADEKTFAPVRAQDAVLRLRELALEHLSPGSRNLGSMRLSLKSADAGALLSDGGLGDLFEEYGVGMPVVAA